MTLHRSVMLFLLLGVQVGNSACSQGDTTQGSAIGQVAENANDSSLATAFEGQDDRAIFDALSNLPTYPGSGQTQDQAYALDAWLGRESSHPKWNWTLLRRTDIRLAIVDRLAEMRRNTVLPIDTTEMREYVLGRLENPESLHEVMWGVLALGHIGHVEDVSRLEHWASEGPGGFPAFSESVMALNFICGPAAEQALMRLREGSHGDRKQFVDRQLSHRGSHHQAWCRNT